MDTWKRNDTRYEEPWPIGGGMLSLTNGGVWNWNYILGTLN